MRKEVILPGIGWIASGIVSIYAWHINPSSSSNLLYIGTFVIFIGILLFLANAKIGEMVDNYNIKGKRRGL